MICTKKQDKFTQKHWDWMSYTHVWVQYSEHHIDHTPTPVFFTTVWFLMLNLLSATDNNDIDPLCVYI